MALPTQSIDVPFTGGVSTKLESVLVDKARLLQASNLTVNKEGTLARRDAWVGMSGGTGINPIELATLGSELLAVDGTTNKLYGYSPNGAQLVSRGNVPQFRMAVDSVAKSTNLKTSLAHATTNGFSIYLWQDWLPGTSANGIKYTVIDEASGAEVVSAAVLDASGGASQAHVCVGGANNGYFLVGYVTSLNPVTHTASVSMAAVQASTGALVTAPTVLATDGAALAGGVNVLCFDVCAFGAGLMLVAYSSGSGSPANGGVTALVANSSGTVVNAETAAMAPGNFSGAVFSVCLGAIGTTTVGLIASDSSTTNAYTAIVTYPASALTVSSTASTAIGVSPKTFGVMSAVLNQSNGKLQVFCSPLVTGNLKNWATFTLSSGNVTTGLSNPLNSLDLSAGTFSGPIIAGRPFSTSTNVFVPVAITSTLQSSVFIVDMSGNLHGVALYGSHYYDLNASFGPPATTTLQDGSFSIAVLRQGTLSFSGGVNTTQAGVARIRLYPGRNGTTGVAPLWHAQAANCLFLSGSYLAMYDGAQVAEAGFCYFPEGVTATIPASNGSNGIAGSYQVVALYEWVDNQGQRHQSAPSTPTTVTVTGGAGTSSTGIAMAAPTLQLGVRAQSCTVVFFRTAANGTTFYRVNSPTAPLDNTRSSLTMTYTDTSMVQVSGADPITSNEILYTISGYLPNDNPPACTAITNWQGRLVYNNAEDGQDWRFSQYPAQGQGLYFNETLLGVRTPQSAGVISGLAVIDDKLVIGTASNKLWVSGAGPNSAGLNGSLSTPQPLPSDVGLPDQRSIALLPDVGVDDGPLQEARPGGLIHQTKHGLYLLDRSLVDRAVGFPVDAYASGKTVTSAVVLQDKGQLRLTVSGASGASVIAYDYLWGQWETFTSTAYTPAAGVVWNGLWTSGDAASGLIQDSLGTYLDGGSKPITWTLVTAWLKLASLQGFERVRRVVLFGSYGGPSTLSAAASQDYSTVTAGNASPILGVTYGFLGGIAESTASLTTTDGLRWQVRWHQENQKVQAVQFTITDTPTGGNYSGVGITGMTLEIGVKKGPTKKLPASQSA